MKLWVDDIRQAPDETWTVARTVASAIRAIAMFGNDMTEISLDHDISHQVTIGDLSRPYPCDETFEPVAWFMAFRYSTPYAPKVTLHTSNPLGAEKMKSALYSRWDEQDCVIAVLPMGLANRLEMEV